MDPTILIFLAVMIALMWFVTRRGKKQQAQARERLNDAMVPGTWVMTIGGFFGKVVEIDGDVVTLESPAGDESIWLRTAIKEAKEPPFADDDDAQDATTEDAVTRNAGPDEVEDAEGPAATSTADPTVQPELRPGGPSVGKDGRLSDEK